MVADALWEAEFRGFFWGEGCIQVHYYYQVRNGIRCRRFRPKLTISVRGDDDQILFDIQKHLGGHVLYNIKPGGDRKLPMRYWTVVAQKEIRNVYRILCEGILPARKRQELQAFGEFLGMMHQTGRKYTDAEKARVDEIIAELRRLKRYSEKPQEGQAISA